MTDEPKSTLDIEALRKGLPEGRWTVSHSYNAPRGYFDVIASNDDVVVMMVPEPLARAIAAIPDMLTEIERLRALNAEMRPVLEDLANDLEAELKHRYRDMLGYPSNARKFELDMAPVVKARAILAKTETDSC